VIKGDSTLETIFPPKDEKPDWATFDEDLPAEIDGPGADGADGERRAEGRFALYSVDAAESADSTKTAAAQEQPATSTAEAPAIATELDYQALTLAQLRARLHTLDIGELEALLAYEQATKARAPFQTLLANRITRANAK
jgi:hypothetical protein